MNTQQSGLRELNPEELGDVNGGFIQAIAALVLGHILWEAVANPTVHNKEFWRGYIEARNK